MEDFERSVVVRVMLKKIFIGLAFSIITLVVWQHELLFYGLMQAKGQVNVLLEAKSIDEYLEDSHFPDSLKKKLRLVQEIRQYSIDQLGIEDHNSYTTLYNQNGKVSLWNLTACEPFELKAKTWSFPLLGSFPYKGFFDLDKAKEERNLLKQANLDTRIRPVSGWSTLGWFDDPILSNMLNRSDGALAELIIHELTHGTLYIKDSADYNENLATFIGEKGAQQFLDWKYGSNSEQLQKYLQNEHDYERYIDHFIRGSVQLDSLYGTMNASHTVEFKSDLKRKVIQGIVNNIDTIGLFDAKRYKRRFEKSLPNNAFFMSFLRYHSKQDDFEKDFTENHNSDVKTYLTFLKQKYTSL